MFKAFEVKKTYIKDESKTSTNFAITKSYSKPQRGVAPKEKKEFVEWPKYRKCTCKHLAEQTYKYANKKCDKYHKKSHISCFHNSFTSLNKGKTPQSLSASSSDYKKNVSCVTQIVANKIFRTGVIQKMITDSGSTQYLIVDRKLIRNYYNDYLEYQIELGEFLHSYGKNILLLPLDNGFYMLFNIWYASDLGFKFISTIQ